MATKKKCGGWVDKLHYAVQHNNLSEVKSLLKSGADVNHKFRLLQTTQMHSRREQTALFMAARLSRIDMMNLLLDNGADVNHVDELGETVLFTAVEEKKNIKYIQRLLKAGADVNHVNKFGGTLAHGAIEAGCPAVLECLFQAGFRFDEHSVDIQENVYLYTAKKYNEAKSRQIQTRIRCDDSIAQMLHMICQHSAPLHFRQVRKITHWCSLLYGQYGILFDLIRIGSCVQRSGCCNEENYYTVLDSLVNYMLDYSEFTSTVYLSLKFLRCAFLCGAKFNKETIASPFTSVKKRNEILDSFENFAKQPKSLTQCARIVVRDSISGNLMKAVKCLPIPTLLQNYLTFSDVIIDDVVKVTRTF